VGIRVPPNKVKVKSEHKTKINENLYNIRKPLVEVLNSVLHDIYLNVYKGGGRWKKKLNKCFLLTVRGVKEGGHEYVL